MSEVAGTAPRDASRRSRAPHDVPAVVIALALIAADAVCRLPLLPTTGMAGALSTTLALSIGVSLLMLLMARLCTRPASDRALIALTMTAGVLAYLVRCKGI